ncbi:MAG: oligosaccharide flippase family protein [Bacteroidota bacterium]
MQKKFLKNLGLLLFLNLLIKPFWILGIDRQVQNTVGPEEYGLYFFLFNFSFLFYIFLDLGITNFNIRNIAQNNQLLNKHLSGISMLKLVLGLLYAVLIIIGGILWGYKGRELYILAWLGFNQFILSFILYLRSNLSGLLLFKTDSFISVLDRVLMIIIVGFLLWFNLFQGKFTIEWFVYSQTAAYLITFAVAIIAVLNKSGKLKFSWNLPFFLLIAKKSAPFALLVLIMSFYNRIDPVLIDRLLPDSIGKEQVGIYAQAFRLLDAGQNFAFLFAVLLLPIFSKMISIKESVENLIKLSASIIISGALIIAITSLFYADNIMQLMYVIMPGETQQHYMLRIDQSAIVLKILMFSFVGISSNYIFGTLLTANHNLKQLNIIAFGGLIINLSLNLILIPYYQSVGSAYASLATQGITAILQLLLVYKLFKFSIDYKKIINMVLLVVSLFVIGYFLTEYEYLRWELSLLVMVVSGLALSIILKLLNIKAFVLIIKGED